MLMFTSLQLCANRKHDFLHDGGTVTCPGMSPSQIILTKKRGEGGNRCGADSKVSRGTDKNPFDWIMGFPAPTPYMAHESQTPRIMLI